MNVAVRARVVPVKRLTTVDRDQMWTLFESMYADVSRAQFEADLDAKRHVILIRKGGIKGFSTADYRFHDHEGRRFLVLFSGDTVVHPEMWGSRTLQNAFGRYMLRVRAKRPWIPAYWLLVSKGYKTYLLLTRNFPEHWPRFDQPTPEWVAGAMQGAAKDWFPNTQVTDGVLKHQAPRGRLRTGIVESPEPTAVDARFFARVNPDHAAGDELICFGKMSWSIWLRYILKGVKRRWGLSAKH